MDGSEPGTQFWLLSRSRGGEGGGRGCWKKDAVLTVWCEIVSRLIWHRWLIQCPPNFEISFLPLFFFLIIYSIFYLLTQYCNPTIAFIRLLNFSMKQEFKPFCCLIVITLSMSRAMERRASLSDGYLSWFSLYLNW